MPMRLVLAVFKLALPTTTNRQRAMRIDLFELVSNESDVSIMIYHTWWEGLTMSLELLSDLADIETVRALKWSAPNESLYRDGLIQLADRLACIDNSGQQIFSHIMGARGFITHLSGFWPQYPAEIWNLLENGIMKRHDKGSPISNGNGLSGVLK